MIGQGSCYVRFPGDPIFQRSGRARHWFYAENKLLTKDVNFSRSVTRCVWRGCSFMFQRTPFGRTDGGNVDVVEAEMEEPNAVKHKRRSIRDKKAKYLSRPRNRRPPQKSRPRRRDSRKRSLLRTDRPKRRIKRDRSSGAEEK